MLLCGHDATGIIFTPVFSLFVEDLGARIWLFGSLPEEKWTLFDLKTCCCGPLLYLCTLGFKMNLYIWEKSFSYLQVPHFILKWLEGRRVPAAQRRNVTFTETHMLTSHAVKPGLLKQLVKCSTNFWNINVYNSDFSPGFLLSCSLFNTNTHVFLDALDEFSSP